MEPDKVELKKDEKPCKEEKQRPHFRPGIEVLEERISPSDIFGFHGLGHGHHHGGQGTPA